VDERIISAEEARRLREAAEQGPYECCEDLLIWASDYDGFDTIGAATDRLHAPQAMATGALLAASWDLAWTVEQVTAARNRLARALAVERGDESQAPAGWSRFGDSGWKRRDQTIIQRFHHGYLDTWERRGLLDGDQKRGPWSCALEAMEAIDAEVSDG